MLGDLKDSCIEELVHNNTQVTDCTLMSDDIGAIVLSFFSAVLVSLELPPARTLKTLLEWRMSSAHLLVLFRRSSSEMI